MALRIELNSPSNRGASRYRLRMISTRAAEKEGRQTSLRHPVNVQSEFEFRRRRSVGAVDFEATDQCRCSFGVSQKMLRVGFDRCLFENPVLRSGVITV